MAEKGIELAISLTSSPRPKGHIARAQATMDIESLAHSNVTAAKGSRPIVG